MIKEYLWSNFILRVVLGAIFLVHGIQKVTAMGLPGVSQFLGSLGFPAPGVASILLIAIEILGGLCLILGLFTRYAALLLAADMLVALVVVHLPKGFYASSGGFEFVLILLGSAIALAISPNSKLSLDGKLFGLHL